MTVLVASWVAVVKTVFRALRFDIDSTLELLLRCFCSANFVLLTMLVVVQQLKSSERSSTKGHKPTGAISILAS